MEQLIIFAIIAIVSSLFGKSKNNKEQKQMPPFNKEEQPQPPVSIETDEPKPQRPTVKTQNFEDFAREFLGNRNAEKPKVEARETRVKRIEEKVMEQMPSYVAPPLIPTEPLSRTSDRPSLGRLAAGKTTGVHVATTNKDFLLPNSKKALMQAVVMAEVLGPPKAKRK